MTRVPYIDLKLQHATIRSKLLEAIGKVLDHGKFILGEEVALFEKRMAAYCGTRYAVGVNSGTDALILTLQAYGIGPGDEVITVPNSFLATASSVVSVGARPVFVDIREDLNINPDLIERAITPKTKAIIPVHLTGRPADMGPIMEIARKHRLFVLEDAAQAIGTIYNGKKTGNLGDAGCFSLHPLKTLNACGDGGIITTDDEELYNKLTQLRNIGLKNHDESDLWGENSRLDSIQAAILNVKFDYLDQWIEERRKNASLYTEYLKDFVRVPVDAPDERGTYHTFVIQTGKRDLLQRHLQEKGIETKVHYRIPIHLQKASQALGYKKGDFPATERLADQILSLPIYHGLTEKELMMVVDEIRSFFK